MDVNPEGAFAMTNDSIRSSLVTATRAVAVTTVAFGLVYPLVVWAGAGLLFARRAEGSPVERDGVVVASEFVGQHFEAPGYVWGRPSATATPYDSSSASASNLAPTNPGWATTVEERTASLLAAHPGRTSVPIELVTASGSGLDPHLSPGAAKWQATRVASASGVESQVVEGLVDELTIPPLFGLFGRPVVNVVELNRTLDMRYPVETTP